ncbi:sulfur oxidation protein [Marinomonas sp. M1K-6]|uniref:Sulfur oxidation protein n=1 Tax=Marinomonas profundi TaxID=2726122 RepID=A0A847R035_9GAMM|nr:DsrE family protein [Marinomonas profundi]NLQ16702.1 sulfur oxidation protein [Marinomonas profundi]UDV03722.1 DsrE family protein [Marinomonas profundi]
MKHTLIHLNSSPYSSLACKEGLDLALVLATFEQPVDLCLSGAALALLTLKQNPTTEQGKNLHKLLDGLEFYDIENVFIQANQRLDPNTTWQGIQPLNDAEWHAMFSHYPQVFRF